MKLSLSIQIALALVLGLALGHFLPEGLELYQTVSKVFLKSIKMIMVPLVFTTLVAGIAKFGDQGSVGKSGSITMLYFVFASLISLSIGLIMATILEPGSGMHVQLLPVDGKALPTQQPISTQGFVEHLVPSSIFKAMADNEILQVVLFSVLLGMALAKTPQTSGIIHVFEVFAKVIFTLVGFVMKLAPLGVLGAIASSIAQHGLGVIGDFISLIGSFYLSLFVFLVAFIVPILYICGANPFQYLRGIQSSLLLAFTTASSESAFPTLIEELEVQGIDRKTSGFVLPLGYSFNLDGSMIYMSFAVLFIAQQYGIELTLSQKITMLLILMVTSKGIAGVPRASLVIISGALVSFGIPAEGLALILGVDQLLDMGRSATNVVGNATACKVVQRLS